MASSPSQSTDPNKFARTILLFLIFIMFIATISVQVRSFEIAGTPLDLETAPAILKKYNKVYSLGINVILLLYTYILFAAYVLIDYITLVPGLELLFIVVNWVLSVSMFGVSVAALSSLNNLSPELRDSSFKKRLQVMQGMVGTSVFITFLLTIWGVRKIGQMRAAAAVKAAYTAL